MARPGDVVLTDRIRRIWLNAVRSGTAFPGEPALARELRASRPAVREALVRLESEGLIHKRQGAGTAVNRAAVEIAARLDQQIDNDEIIKSMGRTVSMEVLEARMIALTGDQSAALEVPEAMPPSPASWRRRKPKQATVRYAKADGWAAQSSARRKSAIFTGG